MAKRKNTRKKKYSKTELKVIVTIVLIVLIATILLTGLTFLFPSLRNIAFIDRWMNFVEGILKPAEETPIVIPDGTVAVSKIASR